MSDLLDRRDAPEAIKAFAAPVATARLELRLAEPADAPAFHRQFADWEVVRWLSKPAWPVELAAIEEFLGGAEERRALGEAVLMAICKAGELIGGIDWNYVKGHSYIGYWLGRTHWGQGLMSEAAAGFVDAIFAQSSERAILSGVFEGNHASLAIQKKLGFVETGISVHYCRARGVDLRHIDTKLTRTARSVAAELTA